MIPVTAEQLKAFVKAEEDIPIVNVLDEDAFEKAHIPGSENIPVDGVDFMERVGDLTGTLETPVVLYCASSSCDASTRAARKLEDVGYSRVYDFEGGLAEWQQEGLPIESGQPIRN